MDELDLLKKDWQRREENLPKLSYDELYGMLLKKSSSIVKWIFYISIIEFVFWAVLNLLSYDKEFLELEKQWHVFELSTFLTVVNYLVLVYFIYKFYKHHKRISVTDSAARLMRSILRVKRTVTQYVWFNIAIFSVSLILLLYGSLRYGEESVQIQQAAANAANETVFWIMVVGTILMVLGFILVLIWLFYKLLYGILLNRLRKNYRELQRMEI